MHKINNPIHIVGISKITSNEAAQNENEIGKLWDVFLKTPIKEKLKDIISDSIFAVYSNYENGHKGKYLITIGYSVKDPNNLFEGLTAVTVPAGNYKEYKAKSPSVEDIVAEWQAIWASDSNVFHRSFVADFEEYKGSEVVINIGMAN
jgi:predicted transcriptional regulator YdeE